MKRIKRFFGTSISMLLLLLFSATILPLESFHNHSTVQQVCPDKQEHCNHSVHITKKAPYCWICAVHFDKSFTGSETGEPLSFLPAVKLLLDNAVTGHVAEILYTALRGPPSE